MITRQSAYVWAGDANMKMWRSIFTDTTTGKDWMVEVIYKTKREAEAAFDFMLNALNDGIAAAKERESRLMADELEAMGYLIANVEPEE